ncbi:hypothetical protein, partial [Muribaculum intestinale]|uniref:hypothetical protein n=1 Tax=Muribaculum intestinale TaxID=1796646 RepID=UPI002430998B
GFQLIIYDSLDFILVWITYPDICRDQFSSANNQWSILEKGTLITDTLPTPQCFVLPIKMASNTLFIDDIPFYLISDEQY